MGMDDKIRKSFADGQLDIPAGRGAVDCGAFSDLFRERHFNSQYGYSQLGDVFVKHSVLMNELAEKNRDLQVGFNQDERVEIILAVLTGIARVEETTVFRLLTNATPEQEASFRFHDRFEVGLDFNDYVWAVNANVTPAELYEVARGKNPYLRGLFRASQGRVTETVRLRHVQHVLAPSFGKRNAAEGYSSNIAELAAAYAEGVLPDTVFRELMQSELAHEPFARVVAALRNGIPFEYAMAV